MSMALESLDRVFLPTLASHLSFFEFKYPKQRGEWVALLPHSAGGHTGYFKGSVQGWGSVWTPGTGLIKAFHLGWAGG